MTVGLNTEAVGPDAPSSLRLSVRDISKRYGQRVAVAGVSFDVRAGEMVAVLGSSGAGKTTLFRCIAGIVTPEQGTITLSANADPQSAVNGRRRIALVYQQFNLVRRLSALGNVLAGRLGHVPAWRGMLRRFERADRLLALACLARVALLEHTDQRADTLSGGQQQRVAIARALAQQPDVIIADEPVASLDPQISADILGLLREIARRDGVAVVCSLHQLHLARRFADRIVGLAGGRLVVNAPVAQFDTTAANMLYGSVQPHEFDG